MNELLESWFAVVVVCFAAYMGSYLREKGRNLATREDIERVLRAQEEMRAQVSGSLWIAQERWRFKANIYTKALVALSAVRSRLEVPATKGQWPDEDRWEEIIASARDLDEPKAVGAIWLDQSAVRPLETFGGRIDEIRRQGGQPSDKQVLMQLCDLIESDIRALQKVAASDLQLRVGTE